MAATSRKVTTATTDSENNNRKTRKRWSLRRRGPRCSRRMAANSEWFALKKLLLSTCTLKMLFSPLQGDAEFPEESRVVWDGEGEEDEGFEEEGGEDWENEEEEGEHPMMEEAADTKGPLVDEESKYNADCENFVEKSPRCWKLSGPSLNTPSAPAGGTRRGSSWRRRKTLPRTKTLSSGSSRVGRRLIPTWVRELLDSYFQES